MGKDDKFDCSSGINQKPWPRIDVQSCITLCTVKCGRVPILTVSVVLTCNLVTVSGVTLCTVVELYGEGSPI